MSECKARNGTAADNYIPTIYTFGSGQPYENHYVLIRKHSQAPDITPTPREFMNRFHGLCWSMEYKGKKISDINMCADYRCLLCVTINEYGDVSFEVIPNG